MLIPRNGTTKNPQPNSIVYYYSEGDSISTFPTNVGLGSDIIDITTQAVYIFGSNGWTQLGASTTRSN